eukprot:CAMPEP_0172567494 /NCGR_PEP_ID=MMETSP1067-20121228/116071_1 /TAXON_ID=265564 ORGANISM="Thalassiosira punctigera, Strain Tpunct2005C2" /NCGR_SAMPLE_ID=MMETSP1067 /ASSEMBLY_ACC=CAM_ASM_000444 /LENGTH=40 /DNA_ID= /DNA_START= /DNA_END= /DNA_ORIENTATION=
MAAWRRPGAVVPSSTLDDGVTPCCAESDIFRGSGKNAGYV